MKEPPPTLDISSFVPQDSAQNFMRRLGFTVGNKSRDDDAYVLNLFGLTSEEYGGTEKERANIKRHTTSGERKPHSADNTLEAAIDDINGLSDCMYNHRRNDFALMRMIDVKHFTGGYGPVIERRNAAYFPQIPRELLQLFADKLVIATEIAAKRRDEFQAFSTKFSQYTGVPFNTVISYFKESDQHELQYNAAWHRREDGETRAALYAELIFEAIPEKFKPPFKFEKDRGNGNLIGLTFGEAGVLVTKWDRKDKVNAPLLDALQNPSRLFNEKVMPEIVWTLENLIQLKTASQLLVTMPVHLAMQRQLEQPIKSDSALRIVVNLTEQEKILADIARQVDTNLRDQWHKMAGILKVDNASAVSISLSTRNVENDLLAQAVQARVQNTRLDGTSGDAISLATMVSRVATERAAEWLLRLDNSKADPFEGLRKAAILRVVPKLTVTEASAS